jgi:hypothetical protein
MVVAAGSSTSGGTGVAFGLDGGVAVGGYAGVQQTELARRLSPGPRPSIGIVGFLGVALLIAGLTAVAGIAATAAERAEVAAEVGAPAVQTNQAGTLIGVAVLASSPGLLTLWLSLRSRRRKMPEWQERVRFAERAWLCHKCGDVWEP